MHSSLIIQNWTKLKYFNFVLKERLTAQVENIKSQQIYYLYENQTEKGYI